MPVGPRTLSVPGGGAHMLLIAQTSCTFLTDKQVDHFQFPLPPPLFLFIILFSGRFQFAPPVLLLSHFGPQTFILSQLLPYTTVQYGTV